MIFEQFTSTAQDITTRFILPVVNMISQQANRWFFVYLLFALTAAFLILFSRSYDRSKGVGENVKQAFERLFPKRVLLHESAKLDYRYALFNHLITSAVVVYFLIAINAASGMFYGFFSSLPLFAGGAEIGIIGSIGIIFAFAFAWDTTNFFQHYLQHRIPILWEFHKVHHSAEVLTPVTAVRLHPVAQLVSASVGVVVYGTLNGLMYSIFAGETAHYVLFGTNLFAVLFYTVGLYHLKHSHVWFTYPKFIKEIFASPSLHLIHHSNSVKHYDKNFGFVFTFWDRVFGSYYDPHEDEQHGLKLGISEEEGRDEYTTVRQLYLTPFKRAWNLHLKPALFGDEDSGTKQPKP